MLLEYLKHLLIRTPFERPAQRLRQLMTRGKMRKHPELHDVYMEPLRTDLLLHRIIGSNSNCVDIGAHLGSMLSTMVRLAPRGRHTAFEPVPHKARWLRRKFPQVDVRATSLGDSSGVITFHQSLDRSGYSAIAGTAPVAERTREIKVPCERLDQIVRHRIDFIKLDVEGAELMVLRGAETVLRRFHPTILFECTKSGLARFNLFPDQVFKFFTEEHDYSIYLIKSVLNGSAPMTADSFREAHQYPFQAFNFVAVAKSQPEPSVNHGPDPPSSLGARRGGAARAPTDS